MSLSKRIVLASAGLILSTGGVLAQEEITGTERVGERLEDIEEETQEQFEEAEDQGRFGFAQAQQGFSGSLSIAGSANSGNTDSNNISGAGRLTYGADPWVNTFGFGLEYGEDDDGNKTDHEIFLTYGARRDITDRLYGFGLGRYEFDEFGPFKEDAFLGAGLGYRVVNTPEVAWRIQAGPGARYINVQDEGDTDTEGAFIAGSRLFYRLSESAFINNDTDLLESDAGLLATNDFGINFRVADNLSTRVSLRTEYNEDPQPGFDETDNTVNFAVVYGF